MGTERQDRIAQLRWETERKEKRSSLEPKLSAIVDIGSFAFLTDKESDEFQLNSDEWPQNKWEDKLFVQAEILMPESIEGILAKMLNAIEEEHLYIFMVNFNFGLIRILKTELIKNWRELIEIDGDEIYCYNPSSSGFICIERTEEFISGREGEGGKWIYELTFSNKELKDKLDTSRNDM